MTTQKNNPSNKDFSCQGSPYQGSDDQGLNKQDQDQGCKENLGHYNPGYNNQSQRGSLSFKKSFGASFFKSPDFLKNLALGLTLMIVTGGLVAGLFSLRDSRHMQLQERYYELESYFLKTYADLDQNKKPYTVEAFDLKFIENLETLSRENPDKGAGQMAFMLLSDFYYRTNQKDKILPLLRLAQPQGDLGILTHYRLLNILLDDGKFQEVITLADSLLKKKSLEVFLPEVRFTKALALMGSNQQELALSELQILVDSKTTENSQIVSKAKKYIKLMKSQL
jgi:hypothetical protein